jgi:hypothetical protein
MDIVSFSLENARQMRRDLPRSKIFLRISSALGGAYFALGVVFILQLHGLSDEHSMAC